MCEFIGEAFQERMLDFHKTNRDRGLVPEHRRQWHAKTLQPIDQGSARKWTREMSMANRVCFELYARESLSTRGYPTFGDGIGGIVDAAYRLARIVSRQGPARTD